jgi:hypothetical protein
MFIDPTDSSLRCYYSTRKNGFEIYFSKNENYVVSMNMRYVIIDKIRAFRKMRFNRTHTV